MATANIDSARRLLQSNQNYIRQGGYTFRKAAGVSASTAYAMKYTFDVWVNISDSERQQLRDEFPKLQSFFVWLDMKAAESNAKTKAANPTDMLKKLGADIKQMMESKIAEGQDQIARTMNATANAVHTDYLDLSKEDFAKKYYQKLQYGSRSSYSAHKFNTSKNGRLLTAKLDGNLDSLIKNAQDAYRTGEHNKIDSLVYKMSTRIGSDIQSYDISKLTDRKVYGEFVIVVKTVDGATIRVETETIYAGGYNIQVLHLRWLMKFKDITGKEVSIEQ